MAQLLQGDIFTVAMERQCGLAVVFGHIGMNEMGVLWRQFIAAQPCLAHIRNPFSEVPGQPVKFGDHQWLWFVPTGDNQGLTEAQLLSALNAALTWASGHGRKSLITNGVANTDHSCDTTSNRASDDARARFIIDFATECEKALEMSITLVSRNDVFLRKATPSAPGR